MANTPNPAPAPAPAPETGKAGAPPINIQASVFWAGLKKKLEELLWQILKVITFAKNFIAPTNPDLADSLSKKESEIKKAFESLENAKDLNEADLREFYSVASDISNTVANCKTPEDISNAAKVLKEDITNLKNIVSTPYKAVGTPADTLIQAYGLEDKEDLENLKIVQDNTGNIYVKGEKDNTNQYRRIDVKPTTVTEQNENGENVEVTKLMIKFEEPITERDIPKVKDVPKDRSTNFEKYLEEAIQGKFKLDMTREMQEKRKSLSNYKSYTKFIDHYKTERVSTGSISATLQKLNPFNKSDTFKVHAKYCEEGKKGGNFRLWDAESKALLIYARDEKTRDIVVYTAVANLPFQKKGDVPLKEIKGLKEIRRYHQESVNGKPMVTIDSIPDIPYGARRLMECTEAKQYEKFFNIDEISISKAAKENRKELFNLTSNGKTKDADMNKGLFVEELKAEIMARGLKWEFELDSEREDITIDTKDRNGTIITVGFNPASGKPIGFSIEDPTINGHSEINANGSEICTRGTKDMHERVEDYLSVLTEVVHYTVKKINAKEAEPQEKPIPEEKPEITEQEEQIEALTVDDYVAHLEDYRDEFAEIGVAMDDSPEKDNARFVIIKRGQGFVISDNKTGAFAKAVVNDIGKLDITVSAEKEAREKENARKDFPIDGKMPEDIPIEQYHKQAAVAAIAVLLEETATKENNTRTEIFANKKPLDIIKEATAKEEKEREELL